MHVHITSRPRMVAAFMREDIMPLDPFISFAIFMVAGLALCAYVVIDGKRDERKQKAARAIVTANDHRDGTPQSF